MSSFAEAIAELNKLAIELDGAGPIVARDIDRITISTAHLIEANAKQIVPVDTGATRSSIGVDVIRDGTGRGYSITAIIGAQTEYAPHLELGTSRMAPRAYLGPSIDRYSPPWVAACEAAAIPPGLR